MLFKLIFNKIKGILKLRKLSKLGERYCSIQLCNNDRAITVNQFINNVFFPLNNSFTITKYLSLQKSVYIVVWES